MVIVLGTTVQPVYTARTPRSGVFHADSKNTDTILLSDTDPTVANDFEELVAGQDWSFAGYVGTMYAKANSGSQTLHVPVTKDSHQLEVKS